jgi:hypothetical protein
MRITATTNDNSSGPSAAEVVFRKYGPLHSGRFCSQRVATCSQSVCLAEAGITSRQMDAVLESPQSLGQMRDARYEMPDAGRAALEEGRIKLGLPSNFIRNNPLTTINRVILVDTRARISMSRLGAHLAHEGEHLADKDFRSPFHERAASLRRPARLWKRARTFRSPQKR